MAKQGRQSARVYGEQSLAAYEAIKKDTHFYNQVLKGGKWEHMMSMAPRYLPVFSEPSIACAMPEEESPSLGLALESYQMEVNQEIINSYADVLPVFNAYTQSQYFVDVFLKGKGELEWQAIPQAPWIKLSDTQGKLSVDGQLEQRIWVSIDWDKVPRGEHKKEAPLGHDYQLIPPSYKVNSAIAFSYGDSSISIGVSAFNPQLEALASFQGFVEDKGFISINAENYSRSKAAGSLHWQALDGLGYSGQSVRAMPLTATPVTDVKHIKGQSPVLEYDFYCFNFGSAKVHVQALPTHAFHDDAGVRCAIAIDDAEPLIVDFQTMGRSGEWKDNVLRNAAIVSAPQIINKAGQHTLRIWMVDPGVMIDQILIDLGGWKASYDFPPETYYAPSF